MSAEWQSFCPCPPMYLWVDIFVISQKMKVWKIWFAEYVIVSYELTDLIPGISQQSICLPACLSVYLPVSLSIYQYICLPTCLSVTYQYLCLITNLSVYLPVSLSAYLSVCYLPVSLTCYQSICLLTCLSVYNMFFNSMLCLLYL